MLGVWQWQRALEKSDLLALHQASDGPAVVLQPNADVQQLHLQPVAISCRPLQDRQLLLDNRVHAGVVGYELLMPCVLSGDVAILLNRGFVAGMRLRDQLPPIATVTPEPASISITGTLALPSNTHSAADVFDPHIENWPVRIQYYDYSAIEQLLALHLMQAVVYVDPPSPWVETYNWQVVGSGPERNYSYALQWFSLALLSLVYMLYFLVKRSRAGAGA